MLAPYQFAIADMASALCADDAILNRKLIRRAPPASALPFRLEPRVRSPPPVPDFTY